MRRTVSQTVLLDLTQLGQTRRVRVVDVDAVAVVGTDAAGWGSGVVSVEKEIGGGRVAYSPAKTLATGTPAIESVEVFDADTLVLRVSTAGTGYGRVSVAGKADNTVEAL